MRQFPAYLFDEESGGGGPLTQPAHLLTLGACIGYNTGTPPGFLPSGNTVGQMNFIFNNAGLDEFISFVSVRSGFNCDYNTNTVAFGPIHPAFQVIHTINGVQSNLVPVPIPVLLDDFLFAPQNPQSNCPGRSNEFSYYLVGAYQNHLTGPVNVGAYFSYAPNLAPNIIAYFTGPGPSLLGYWCKVGNLFYLADLIPPGGLYSWSVAAGMATPTAGFNPPLFGPVGPLTLAGNRVYRGMKVTATSIWLLDINDALGSAVYQCDLNGNLVNTFPLGLTLGPGGLIQFEVINDSLVYLWGQQTISLFTMYSMNVSDGIVSPLNGVVPNFPIPPNTQCAYGTSTDLNLFNQLIFHNNAFFTGYAGQVTGVGTAKITILP